MATREMTFVLPTKLAVRLVRSVKPSRRAGFVAQAIEAKLGRGEDSWAERERMLKEACLAANDDPEPRQIEAEFDALPDRMPGYR